MLVCCEETDWSLNAVVLDQTYEGVLDDKHMVCTLPKINSNLKCHSKVVPMHQLSLIEQIGPD